MKTNEQSLKNLGDADLEHHGKLRAFENFFEQQFARLRLPGLVFFLVVTVFLGYFAAQLRPDASLQKMVPASHPYIVNYLKYENELRPLGNVIRVAVENTGVKSPTGYSSRPSRRSPMRCSTFPGWIAAR